MAQSCPKCAKPLKLTNLKPQCPHCKTNLLYYKIEERLEVDALNAEMQHAVTQKRLDRAKASMIGGPLAIVRDVLLVLSVVVFLLPLAELSASGPYFEKSTTFTAIELVNSLMEFDFGVFDLIGSSVVGQTTLFFGISIICVALAAVMALLQLILSFLACSPKGFIRSVAFSGLGAIFAIASSITFNMFIKSMNEVLPGFMTGSVRFGIYVVAAMFLLVLGLNIFIKVKGGIKVKYKQCYIGHANIPYEEFVEEFGKDKITLETVLANSDRLLNKKEKAEKEEVNA